MHYANGNEADPEEYWYPEHGHFSFEDGITIYVSAILFSTVVVVWATGFRVTSPSSTAVFVAIFYTEIVVTWTLFCASIPGDTWIDVRDHIEEDSKCGNGTDDT